MAGLNGVLDTAMSGLEAYRAALDTVSQNIANATTPGYARRSPLLVTRFDGVGDQAGTGVEVSGIQRTVSRFADTRLRSANAELGYAKQKATSLDALQGVFPATGGVGSALDQFLSDAKNLAVQPQSIPARQTLIADGRQLAGAFAGLAGNINEAIQGLGKTGQDATAQANALLTQLHTLNQQLRSRSSGNTNSLLDNQSALLQQLSQLVGFHVVRHGNGTVRLSVDGQVLLDQAGAASLQVITQQGRTPVLRISGGHDVTGVAAKGQIGGVLEAMVQTQAQLQRVNAMAVKTAATINIQQSMGLQLDGQQGKSLFSLPAPTVFASQENTGTETVQATLVSPQNVPSDGGPYALRYTGSAWQAVNQANGKVRTLGAGPDFSFGGMQVHITGGAPQAGDTFSIDPAAGAAQGITLLTQDPSALAAAVPYTVTAGVEGANGGFTDTNTGDATIGAGAVAAPSAGDTLISDADFGNPLQVVFTASHTYQVKTTTGTVLATGSYDPTQGAIVAIAYPAGSAAAGKVWAMSISGDPGSGDTFTLSPGGPQSGGNADAMGQLGANTGPAGGDLDGDWSGVVGNVGAQAAIADNAKSNASTKVTHVTAAQQSISGVSLDEQAGQLQQYSESYQAAAKAIQTVGTLFQDLLRIA